MLENLIFSQHRNAAKKRKFFPVERRHESDTPSREGQRIEGLSFRGSVAQSVPVEMIQIPSFTIIPVGAILCHFCRLISID
jgi:hypothetical protein